MSEYYWGYAAAANAHLINPFEEKKSTTNPPRLQSPREVGEQADEEDADQALPPPSQPPPPLARPPARSNSTSRAFGRPRFRAHARTTSTDSGSSSSRGAGYRSSHDTPLPSSAVATAAASSAARKDSSDRERQEHKDLKERKEHKDLRSRWHHRWASTSATKDAASSASPSTPSSPLHLPHNNPQTPRFSAPWFVTGSSPVSAPASPAPPNSASGLAPTRHRFLHKLCPTTSPAAPVSLTSEHPSPQHQVPSRSSSPHGRHHEQQPPAIPQGGTAHPAESAPAYSKPQRFFASTPAPTDEHLELAGSPRSSVAAAIAGLAAVSGASIPRSVTSPSRASFSQRITQHLADRRHNQQSNGPQVPLPSLPQTQSQQRQRHASVLRESPAIQKTTVPFARVESNSSGSGATVSSARTMMSATDPPPTADGLPYRPGTYSTARPSNPRGRSHFVTRNGRTYLADPTLDYPLPVDLPELHRCSMKTLMLFQLFGGPICSPLFQERPPARVLDLACGSGFWSMMCHRYWSKKGHPNIQFTGVDIAPIAGASGWGFDDPAPSASSASSMSDGAVPAASLRPPDKDMKWRFIQHDARRFPWPFNDSEFDFVMMQSTSTVAPYHMTESFVSEILRVLRPGGTLEIWESDFTIRMLRPHVPTISAAVPGGWSSAAAAAAATTAGNVGPDSDEDSDEDDSSSNDDSGSDQESSEGNKEASRMGAYVITSNTPMSSPLNNFLVEYNSWVTKALASCQLSPVPCTNVNYVLLAEEQLTGVGSRRMAVPLSEVKWEREGVGGVVTKGDGKSYVSTTAKAGKGGEEAGGGEGSGSGSVGASSGRKRKGLSPNQAALRRTALETVVQLIQSLEPVLREASGKSQDEWDTWQGKMQNNLLLEGGTSWGECLEVGAWYARKK